jgi:hypothetical protein
LSTVRCSPMGTRCGGTRRPSCGPMRRRSMLPSATRRRPARACGRSARTSHRERLSFRAAAGLGERRFRRLEIVFSVPEHKLRPSERRRSATGLFQVFDERRATRVSTCTTRSPASKSTSRCRSRQPASQALPYSSTMSPMILTRVVTRAATPRSSCNRSVRHACHRTVRSTELRPIGEG